MNEGATLKVREMLAMGLPIYSGHVDTALPPEFPYYVNGEVDISAIIDFAQRVRNVPRKTVRGASIPYVDKRVWVEELGGFLRKLSTSE